MRGGRQSLAPSTYGVAANQEYILRPALSRPEIGAFFSIQSKTWGRQRRGEDVAREDGAISYQSEKEGGEV